jgi:hypothetical protein
MLGPQPLRLVLVLHYQDLPALCFPPGPFKPSHARKV